MTTNTEPLDASVTLEEIFTVVAQKRAPLTPELAGYLVLELAESAGNAGDIDARSVYVSEEGSVAFVRGPQDPTGDAERSLRRLLAKLLETAGASTPALAAVAKRKSGAGVLVMVEELEASLIPVNRSAGKRALARLARETKRVTNRIGRNASSVPDIARSPAPPVVAETPDDFDEHEAPTADRADTKPPPADDSASNLPTVGISKEELTAAATRAKRDSVDSLLDSFEVSGQREDKALSKELKAMAGLEPTKTPPPVRGSEADAIESLLAESAPSVSKQTGRESPVARRSAPAREETRAKQPSFAEDRQLPTAPSAVRKLSPSLTSEAKKLQRKSGSGVGVVLLFVLIVAGFAVALWLVKPGFLTGRTPEKIAAEKAAAEAERARIAAQAAQPACHASLVVTGAPKDAEILIREGQAPVDVEHMPSGTRLEFVATAEGYAPKRAIVPEGAPWDKANGKPKFDLPVQLDKSRVRAGAVDRWPAAEAGSEVGGKGDPGTVHVISSPKGAEVWLVAGIGQENASDPVAIEDIVSCDTDVDVLVAGPTTYRKRLHVPASSFVPDPSGKAGVRVAHLAVK
ncbi:MAG TPA: hypothetical protein VGH28_17805 [Polyangiaceae bacterium]|jgi:hypothetical protein